MEGTYLGDARRLGLESLTGPAGSPISGVLGLLLENLDPTFHERQRYQEILTQIGRFLQTRHLGGDDGEPVGLRSLLRQAKALTWANHREIGPISDYIAHEKPNGWHACCLARPDACYVLTDKIEFHSNWKAARDRRTASLRPVATTLAEAEWIEGVGLYLLDVLLMEGEDIRDRPYQERLAFLPRASEIFRSYGLKVGEIPFLPAAAHLSQVLDATTSAPATPDPDGIILTSGKTVHRETQSFKWKPRAHLSIDFLARRASEEAAPGPDATVLYHLFVSADRHAARTHKLIDHALTRSAFGSDEFSPSSAILPVPFCPSDHPTAYRYRHTGEEDLDGQIIELTVDEPVCDESGEVRWKLLRQRPDRKRETESGRSYGNYIAHAENIWREFLTPLTREALLNLSRNDLTTAKQQSLQFANSVFATSRYRRSLDIHGYLMDIFKDADWVVDLGSGCGNLLPFFYATGARNLVCVDRDPFALTLLIDRKHQIPLERKRYNGTSCHVLTCDLRDAHLDLVHRIRELSQGADGADVVSCDMTLQYFARDRFDLEHLVRLFRALIKPGGHLVISYIRGDLLHREFGLRGVAFGSAWSENRTDDKTQSCVRLYPESVLLDAGQAVGLSHSSVPGMVQKEYIVNPVSLHHMLRRHGFHLVRSEGSSSVAADAQIAIPAGVNLARDQMYCVQAFRYGAEEREEVA